MAYGHSQQSGQNPRPFRQKELKEGRLPDLDLCGQERTDRAVWLQPRSTFRKGKSDWKAVQRLWAQAGRHRHGGGAFGAPPGS